MTRKTRKSLVALALGVALTATVAVAPPARASDPFIGQIQIFALNFAVRNWAQCDGQLLQISQNTALFSLLGTIYGGDGRTTLGLPDLRGRVPIHMGNGPGLTPRTIGSRGGAEAVVLTENQMPAHTHTASVRVASAAGNQETPAAGMVLARDARDRAYSTAAPDVDLGHQSITVSSAGSGQAHDNMPPFLTLNYQIALQGTFPSRN